MDDLAKDARAPHFWLFDPKREWILQMALVAVLLPVTMQLIVKNLPKVQNTVWAPFVLSFILITIIQVVFYIVKRWLPSLIVEVGEGVRLKRKALAPWRFLLPRVIWQAILFLGAVVIGYGLYKH